MVQLLQDLWPEQALLTEAGNRAISKSFADSAGRSALRSGSRQRSETMATIDRTDVCATCGSDLEGGRTVQVYAAAVYAFCSERCFAAALAGQKKQRWAARRRAAKVIAIGAVVVGALLTPHPRPSQIDGVAGAGAARGRGRTAAAARRLVRARVAADRDQPARGAGPRRVAAPAGRSVPPHAAQRLARVRRRAAGEPRRRVPQRPLRRRPGRRDLGRAHPRRSRRRRRTTSSAGPTPSTAGASCASRTATAR